MIRIYKVISRFFLYSLISFRLLAKEDANTYCFEKNVLANQVEDVISFLVTGTDRIQVREKDNCIDIVTNAERLKIYEKLIWKNFKPINTIENQSTENGEDSLTNEHCRLEIKEIKKSKLDSTDFKINPKLSAGKSESIKNETITSELLILKGKSASMKMGNQDLQIRCVRTQSGLYNLNIYLEEKNKNSISTYISLKESEVINLGNIKKELNEKSKTLGSPNIDLKEQVANDEITYELRIK